MSESDATSDRVSSVARGMAPGADGGRRMTAAEVSRGFGQVQDAVSDGPVVVTHHGRERLAILSWDAYRALLAEAGTVREDAVAAARRKLLLVLDAVTEGYVSIDRNWRFTTLNRAAELYFGQPREELLGRVWTEAFPALRGTEAETQLRRAAEGGQAVEFDWDSRLQAGRSITVRAFPLPRPEGGVGVLFSDSARRAGLEHRARSAEARLAAVLRELPGWATLSYDADGVITAWSEGGEALLGWSEADTVGRPVEMLFTDEDRAAGAPWSEMARARRDGRADARTAHVAKEGAPVLCHDIVVPLGDGSGQMLKILRRIADA